MSGWQKSTIGEVCRLINGRAYKKSELLRTGPYRVLRVGNFFTNEHWYYSDLELEPDKYCDDGDLLYAWSASFGPRFWSGEKVIYHYHIWKVEPRADVIDPRFLFWFFEWDKEQIKKDQGAGATMIHVSKGSMEARAIAVPPLPEQRRIVAVLDEAFAGIVIAKVNAEKNLRNARALFESELHSAFRGDDWESRPFEECIEKVKNTPKVQRNAFLESGSHPIISQEAGFINGYWNEAADLFRVSQPVVLFGDHTKIFKFVDFDFVLGADGVKILSPKRFLDPKFFYYQLRSIDLETLGYARHYRLLRESTLRYPRRPEQTAIATRLDALEANVDRLAALYQQKLAALDALKRSLLHRAFSGRLTQKDPTVIVETKPRIPFPAVIPSISTTDLHAGVLAIAAEVRGPQESVLALPHVTSEKIGHLVEAHLGIDLGRNPVKDAAGPNDFPRLKKVEHRARMTKVFDYGRASADGPFELRKLNGFNRHLKKTEAALGEHYAEVRDLIERLLALSVRQVELVATVFAGWNNLLLDGKRPTDEEIVYESRENWHPDKLKIERERFFNAIAWMRQHSIVPQGRGKRVAAKGR